VEPAADLTAHDAVHAGFGERLPYGHLAGWLAWLDDAGGELPGDPGGGLPAPYEQNVRSALHDGDGDPEELAVPVG